MEGLTSTQELLVLLALHGAALFVGALAGVWAAVAQGRANAALDRLAEAREDVRLLVAETREQAAAIDRLRAWRDATATELAAVSEHLKTLSEGSANLAMQNNVTLPALRRHAETVDIVLEWMRTGATPEAADIVMGIDSLEAALAKAAAEELRVHGVQPDG